MQAVASLCQQRASQQHLAARCLRVRGLVDAGIQWALAADGRCPGLGCEQVQRLTSQKNLGGSMSADLSNSSACAGQDF